MLNTSRNVDQELRPPLHGNIDVPKIQCEDGRLLADLGPGRKVGRPEDVARLLGEEAAPLRSGVRSVPAAGSQSPPATPAVVPGYPSGSGCEHPGPRTARRYGDRVFGRRH